MLEEFLKRNLYIEITEQDIFLLNKLQELVSPLMFKSGDSLNGIYMKSLLNKYKKIWIHITGTERPQCISFCRSEPFEVWNCATIAVFTDAYKPYTIELDDLNKLLVGD